MKLGLSALLLPARGTTFSLFAFALVCIGILTSPQGRAGPLTTSLISVDFGTAGSPLYTGVEPKAATANPVVFGGAHIWNAVNVPTLTPASNPAFLNLLDNSGAPTSVALSLMGNVLGFDASFVPSTDNLREDYIFLNSANNPAGGTSLSWVIAGLTPGHTYSLYIYAGNGGNAAPGDRNFDMTVDKNGINTPITQTILGIDGGALFSDIVPLSGVILGELTGIGSVVDLRHEANWAGFQLADTTLITPEPSSLALLSLGIVALAVCRLRKFKSLRSK